MDVCKSYVQKGLNPETFGSAVIKSKYLQLFGFFSDLN